MPKKKEKKEAKTVNFFVYEFVIGNISSSTFSWAYILCCL